MSKSTKTGESMVMDGAYKTWESLTALKPKADYFNEAAGKRKGPHAKNSSLSVLQHVQNSDLT